MYILLTLPPLPTYDNGEEIEEWYNNLNRRCGLVSLFLSRPNSRRFILQWLELRALAQPPTMSTVVPSNINANPSNHLITEDQMPSEVPGSGQATSSEVCLEERQENPVIPVQSGQSLGYERQFVAQRITDSGRDGHTNGVDVAGRNGPTTYCSSLLPPKLSRKRKHCDTEKSSSARWKHEERLNSTSDVHSDWELPVKRARMDFNRSGCAICRAPEYDVTDMLQCWCTFFVGDGEIEEMH
ncbi:hypothetical protein CPB84DRAFT_1795398 [Gymnopilus junonius]|uniref:Uncharacterized protein n=1 Tax=Gymnopilus junonius TaxID=109634 RepID=A0A9P5N9T7_GYMJU|nr:hypothetical protein CPB84DRAFT_1795398 [Gymnopilus junonius]